MSELGWADHEELMAAQAATIARLEADAARYFRDGEAARERVRVLVEALAKADAAVSEVHGTIWARDWELRDRASNGIWRVHDIIRPVLAAVSTQGLKGGEGE